MAVHGHGEVKEIKNPGPIQISSNFKTALIVLCAVGLATFIAALLTDPTRAWSSFLVNHFYFLSLALGGAFFASLQWLTGAMWSAPIRRLSESFTAYLPIAFLTLLILFVGIHYLYNWSNPAYVAADSILQAKSGYLNVGFFIIRNMVAFALWFFLIRKMMSNSIAQDWTKEVLYTKKNGVLAPLFLMVFAVTFTMVSFDQIMSLDGHWFSTMFGVYTFAGLFYSTLAATCILTIVLKRKGVLKGIVNENHLHDLGKFMFAFTVFWAYIAFSQFMLIWYANLPETTGYFIKRFDGGWMYVSAFLLLGKFLLPFFLLLPREAKRNETLLLWVAVFMLVAQWIDMMWLVQPEFYADRPRFGVIEIGMILGFLGIFGLMISRFLSRYNVVAIGDPRLEESVHHHHQ
jgi:hypothetical protein